MAHRHYSKLITLCLLIALIVGAVAFLWFSSEGRRIIADPHVIGQDVRAWVGRHPVAAPAAFIGAYLLLSILALPVWWLQILGGYGFGLMLGVAWSQAGATLGATTTFLLSRWLTSDWFQEAAQGKMRRLRALGEKLGHNGLLVVMAVRLAHVLPFGISNYVFSLTRIAAVDVFIGTLLGNVPAATVYVTLGANRRLFEHWQFIAILAGINLLLLIPLGLRYWRPGWFKKMGIE